MSETNDQKPHSLGDFLRHSREKRGITIEQVAAATRISVRVLHALESDDFADLPAKPFVRGFVASYAQFVGLDSKQTLIDFDHFIDLKSKLRPNRETGHSGYAFEKKDGDQNQTVLWAVMGSFIVVGALGLLIFKPTSHRKHALESAKSKTPSGVQPAPTSPDAEIEAALAPNPLPSVPVPTTAQAPEPQKPPAVSPIVTQPPTRSPNPAPLTSGVPVVAIPTPPPPTSQQASAVQPTPSAPAGASIPSPEDPLQSGIQLSKDQIKHKIIMKALADVWVRYQCDARPPMKFILRKDRVLVLRGESAVKVQFSNPNAITVNYNHGGNRVAKASPELKEVARSATLTYPTSSLAEAQQTFGNDAPLPKTPDPAPEAPTTPSPTP